MYEIAICIPTYKRLAMLEKLIQSIAQNRIDTGLIKNVNILIVDNDLEKTAEKVIQNLACA